MRIAPLTKEVLNSSPVSELFLEALDGIDRASACSSLAVRNSLASLIVANPTILRRNFRRHSYGELATSRTLEGVASKMKPTQLRDHLLKHAADESRHSRVFRALADSLARISGVVDDEDYDWILQDDRRFVEQYNGDVVEFVCDVFAAEVRTYSFLKGYLDALADRPSGYEQKTRRVLAQVLQDERRHIAYTAGYINQWMGDGLDLAPSLERSIKGFDRNSWVDVAVNAQLLSELS